MKGQWTTKKVTCLVILIAILFLAIGLAIPTGYRKVSTLIKDFRTKGDVSSEVLDYVKLGKYKGVKVSLKVTKEDLASEIDSVLEEHISYKKLRGTAQDGDMVRVDYIGEIDGEKMELTAFDDYVTLGSGEQFSQFDEAITGMKTGETKTVSIQIPNGAYGDDSVDGKLVDYTIHLSYICGDSIEPEYNDAFVQSVSEYQTTDEYDAYLTEVLKQQNEEDKAEYAWAEVFEKAKIIKYPEKDLKQAEKIVLQGYYDMADLYQCDHDEIFQYFGFQDEKEFVDTELESLAKDTVKDYLVARAIAYEENITYTDKSYQTTVQEEYDNHSDVYKSKKAYEKENKQYIKNETLLKTVKSWVDKHAKYDRES